MDRKAPLRYPGFLEFDADDAARVAVFLAKRRLLCRLGFEYVSTLDQSYPRESSIFLPRGLRQWRRDPPRPLDRRGRAGQARHCGIAGPAVAGGMELALWCDFRCEAEDAYFGRLLSRWAYR